MSEKVRDALYIGPGGVFYDPKYDEIFVLQDTGIELRIKNKLLGRRYSYWTAPEKYIVTYVSGISHCIRLGDL